MIVLIPTNALAASKVKELQTMQMKSKDERVKVTTEVLSGIKVSIQFIFTDYANSRRIFINCKNTTE